MQNSNKKSLRSRALDFLARREMSRVELAQKLAKYTEDQAELEALLDEFASKNWQSDQRFTQNFVELRSRKYGYRRIVEELKQKGIGPDDSSQYKPERDTELQAAFEILEKKFKTAPVTPEEKQKQMRFLAYRGFDFDIISAAIKHWKEQDEY